MLHGTGICAAVAGAASGRIMLQQAAGHQAGLQLTVKLEGRSRELGLLCVQQLEGGEPSGPRPSSARPHSCVLVAEPQGCSV